MNSTQDKIEPKVKKQLEELGLDWKVEKRKLWYETQKGFNPTPFFGTVRTDTQTPLGTVSDRYEPKQNEDILQLIHDASKEHNLEIKTGGPFKGGKRVFFQLKMPENIRIDNDDVEKYLFAYSSHDGSSSLRFGLCNRVIFCDNQFNYMLSKSKFSVRHTQSIHEQSQLLSQKIGAILLKQENLYSVFQQFAEEEVDAKLISAMVDKVFKMEKYWEKHEEMSTRRENQIMELSESIEYELSHNGSNAWGLFNGITHYANHKKSHPNRENGRLESIMDGGGQKFMMRGFNFLRKELGINLNLN